MSETDSTACLVVADMLITHCPVCKIGDCSSFKCPVMRRRWKGEAITAEQFVIE